MKLQFGVAALAATALIAAGCGGSSDNNNSNSSSAGSTGTHASMSMAMSSKSSGKGGVDTAASSLRSTLTAGLQEHVYLAGIAVENGVTHGLGSPQFKA